MRPKYSAMIPNIKVSKPKEKSAIVTMVPNPPNGTPTKVQRIMRPKKAKIEKMLTNTPVIVMILNGL